MKTLFTTIALLVAVSAQAQQKDMTFFITSAGPGNGADLGGLQGADAHCQKLAQAAGAGQREWRAYLSTQGKALNVSDWGRVGCPARIIILVRWHSEVNR